ncbi:MAG: GAF domain-containing sensor histidine kinase [Nocardioides sp.]|uniref:sensor histidine kinase n=1 Tax=Nocardioides sp. TaxID=35761 RepID=UPI0039E2161A
MPDSSLDPTSGPVAGPLSGASAPPAYPGTGTPFVSELAGVELSTERSLVPTQELSGEQNLADVQLIIDSLTALAGFGVASVSIVRDDSLQAVAVSGSAAARETLFRHPTPISVLAEDLARADDWGLFKFVPAERLGESQPWGWVPDLEPTDDPGAWHPLDLLVAPLRDAEGRLRATLTVDVPRDGRRPDAERRATLARYAAQAEQAILRALARRGLARQLRLAEHARDIVRDASRHLGPDEMITRIGPQLLEVFHVVGLWFFTVELDGSTRIRRCLADDRADLGEIGHILVPSAADAARLWAEQRVGHVDLHRETGTTRVGSLNRTGRIAELRELSRSHALTSLVCAPLGAGDDCHGALVLAGASGVPWSEIELTAAFELGSDLGRLLHRSRTYQRQQAAARRLRELNGHKSNLIATVAHELKNPLTALGWNAEVLPTTRTPQEYADTLLVMMRNRDRTERIVDDLAMLSAVSDPDQLPASRPVDVGAAVRSAYELAAIPDAPSIVLELPVPPLWVAAAPGELERVVLNLLTNAVKYAGDDRAPILVRVAATEADGTDLVELRVIDHGIGISESDQRRLFTEFFRTTNPEALAQPGTGLGLTIVERIVTSRGGTVEVDSALGRGTTFVVRLPRVGQPEAGVS